MAISVGDPFETVSLINPAIQGTTVGNWSTITAATLAKTTNHPVRTVLINLGVNDLNFWPLSQATWQNNYLSIIDAIHTAYPNAKISISKVWRRFFNTECDALAGWIDNIIAARSTFVSVADDERGWMKGTDDGATMTYDGVHYSAAGQTEKLAQMKAVLGY